MQHWAATPCPCMLMTARCSRERKVFIADSEFRRNVSNGLSEMVFLGELKGSKAELQSDHPQATENAPVFCSLAKISTKFTACGSAGGTQRMGSHSPRKWPPLEFCRMKAWTVNQMSRQGLQPLGRPSLLWVLMPSGSPPAASRQSRCSRLPHARSHTWSTSCGFADLLQRDGRRQVHFPSASHLPFPSIPFQHSVPCNALPIFLQPYFQILLP